MEPTFTGVGVAPPRVCGLCVCLIGGWYLHWPSSVCYKPAGFMWVWVFFWEGKEIKQTNNIDKARAQAQGTWRHELSRAVCYVLSGGMLHCGHVGTLREHKAPPDRQQTATAG